MAKRTVCRGAVGANVGRIAQVFDLCSALRQVGDIGVGRQMAYNGEGLCPVFKMRPLNRTTKNTNF